MSHKKAAPTNQQAQRHPRAAPPSWAARPRRRAAASCVRHLSAAWRTAQQSRGRGGAAREEWWEAQRGVRRPGGCTRCTSGTQSLKLCMQARLGPLAAGWLPAALSACRVSGRQQGGAGFAAAGQRRKRVQPWLPRRAATAAAAAKWQSVVRCGALTLFIRPEFGTKYLGTMQSLLSVGLALTTFPTVPFFTARALGQAGGSGQAHAKQARQAGRERCSNGWDTEVKRGGGGGVKGRAARV